MAKKYPLVCCDFCGRDTRNKSRICSACMRGIRKQTMPPDDLLSSAYQDRCLDTATHDGADPYDRSESEINYDGESGWMEGN